MLRFSETITINGYPIYTPLQPMTWTEAPILDPNSGLTDDGEFKFEVINVRLACQLKYPLMTADELNYMLDLIREPTTLKPIEFLFKAQRVGRDVSFWAYSGSNLTYDTVIDNVLYSNLTISISETRKA